MLSSQARSTAHFHEEKPLPLGEREGSLFSSPLDHCYRGGIIAITFIGGNGSTVMSGSRFVLNAAHFTNINIYGNMKHPKEETL